MSTLLIVTPTGDRPESLKRCRSYIERVLVPATFEVNWLVLDDGVKPFNPGGCEYRRRKPDGPKSLERQMASIVRTPADYVAIWEDDDWYHPERLVKQLCYIHDGVEMHGFTNTLYYHAPSRRYRFMRNNFHASFFEVVMTGQLFNEFLSTLNPTGKEPFIDIRLWKRFGNRGKLTPNEPRVSVGIKGMPGREGLGSGHKALTQAGFHSDPNGEILERFAGKEDSDFIFKTCH